MRSYIQFHAQLLSPCLPLSFSFSLSLSLALSLSKQTNLQAIIKISLILISNLHNNMNSLKAVMG